MITTFDVARAVGVSTVTVSRVLNNHPQADPRLAMQELLDQGPRPDAVFVTNHLMTIGTLQAVAQAKLVSPSGIAVFRLNDVPWASLLQPRPTAVAQPALLSELLCISREGPSRGHDPMQIVCPDYSHDSGMSCQYPRKRASSAGRTAVFWDSHPTREEASLKVPRRRSVRRAEITTDGRNLVSHAGTALSCELADRTGLTRAISVAMADCGVSWNTHDPGVVLTHLAVAGPYLAARVEPRLQRLQVGRVGLGEGHFVLLRDRFEEHWRSFQLLQLLAAIGGHEGGTS